MINGSHHEPLPPENSLEISTSSAVASSQPLESSSKDHQEPFVRRSALPRLTFGLINLSILGLPDSQFNGDLTTPKSSNHYPLPPPPPPSSTNPSTVIRTGTPFVDQAEDFTLNYPPFYPPPPVISTTIPYPKTQGEVNQDFSRVRPPSNQVPIHQFQNWINDHYLRSFGEDDLAFLGSEYLSINGCPSVRVHHPSTTTPTTTASKADEAHKDQRTSNSNDDTLTDHHHHHPPKTSDHTTEEDHDEIYQVPKLGRHYTEVWKEEDQQHAIMIASHHHHHHHHHHDLNSSSSSKPTTSLPPPSSTPTASMDAHGQIPHLSAKDLSIDHLSTERIQLGPLTERLVSSIHPISHPSVGGDDHPVAATTTTVGRMGGKDDGKIEKSTSAIEGLSSDQNIDHVELEKRVMNELRFVGILAEDEEIDWNQREDDEISIMLRKTQSILKLQSKRNKRRKQRLIDLVKERIAFQEFDLIKDGLDRLLIQNYNKKLQLMNSFHRSQSTTTTTTTTTSHHPSTESTTTGHHKKKNHHHSTAHSTSSSLPSTNGTTTTTTIKLKNRSISDSNPPSAHQEAGEGFLSTCLPSALIEDDPSSHQDPQQQASVLAEVQFKNKLKNLDRSIADSLEKRHEFLDRVGRLFEEHHRLEHPRGHRPAGAGPDLDPRPPPSLPPPTLAGGPRGGDSKDPEDDGDQGLDRSVDHPDGPRKPITTSTSTPTPTHSLHHDTHLGLLNRLHGIPSRSIYSETVDLVDHEPDLERQVDRLGSMLGPYSDLVI